MTNPELTVIVPTRDRPEMLRETLESILTAADAARAKLGAEVRILVVDDASPGPATRRVVTALADHAGGGGGSVDYARVALHDGRKDPGAAIRLGVSLTASPYLTIFGDDDVILPGHIAVHLRNMRKGFDVSAGSFHITDGHLNRLATKRRRAAHLGDFLAGRIDVNDGAFVRTELIQTVGLDPSLLAQMLYPVWATLLIEGRKFTYSRRATFLHRRHDGNISSVNKDERDAALREALQKRFQARALEQFGELPKPRPVDWARHGREWRRSKAGYLRWRLAATELAVKRNPVVRKVFGLPPLPAR